MQIATQCDEIGTTVLLSDADLALTIIRIANDERRRFKMPNSHTGEYATC